MFGYVLHAAEYVFTEAGRRTASAVCVSNVRLLVITYEPVSYTHLDVYKRQSLRWDC